MSIPRKLVEEQKHRSETGNAVAFIGFFFEGGKQLVAVYESEVKFLRENSN